MNRSRYVTDIKDLVIQTLANGSEIKAKAVGGDALSCFQMGMIHMFGINTPIEFKEASKYFGYQSLSDDPDAKRLLGFISECEGYYSEAFKRYANAADIKGSDKKDYITKVYEERNYLLGYFKKIGLADDVLNKEISQLLNDYIGDGHSKIDACIKLATICNDEPLCLEVAQNYSSIGDYYSAKKWLLKGNIDSSNHLYIYVKEQLIEIEDAIKTSRDLEVIDINGDSLVEKQNISSITGIDNLNIINVNTCKQDWQASVSQVVESIKRILEEEERLRLQKIQEEEAERQRRIQEETSLQKKHQEEEVVLQNEIQETETICQQSPSGKILNVWINNSGNLSSCHWGIPDQIAMNDNEIHMNEFLTTSYTNTFGFKCHCNILLSEYKGKRCKIILSIKPSNGGEKSEGTIFLMPDDDICGWKDLQITFSSFNLVQLGIKIEGRYNFDVCLSLYDDKDNQLDVKSVQLAIDYIHHMDKNDEYIVV